MGSMIACFVSQHIIYCYRPHEFSADDRCITTEVQTSLMTVTHAATLVTIGPRITRRKLSVSISGAHYSPRTACGPADAFLMLFSTVAVIKLIMCGRNQLTAAVRNFLNFPASLHRSLAAEADACTHRTMWRANTIWRLDWRTQLKLMIISQGP
jgi:hypothetical protein